MKKRLTSIALALVIVMSFATTAFAATFIDVPESNWAYQFIEKAAANNLVKGVGNGNYNPGNNVTNAEWSQMIVNLLEPERNALGGGTGVKWYYGALDFTDRSGILNGTVMYTTGIDRTMPGTYKDDVANSTINRHDMGQTIFNIANNANYGFTLTVDTTNIGSYIADYQSIPTNYRTTVEYCYAAGFLTGKDSIGTFAGNDNMTRAEAATVLCRLLDATNGYWTVPTRGNTETPVVTNTVVKDMIKVTANPASQPNYDYEVTVTNTLTAGKLSNGKDINATNIAAMLAEIKAIFPAGTSWGKTTSTDDSYYFSSTHGAPVAGGACNSFAGMTFSTLFGKSAKYTSSNDLYSAKAGDLIEFKNANGVTQHSVIVMSNDGTELIVCEGNTGGKVGWDRAAPIAYTLTLYPKVVVHTAY